MARIGSDFALFGALNPLRIQGFKLEIYFGYQFKPGHSDEARILYEKGKALQETEVRIQFLTDFWLLYSYSTGLSRFKLAPSKSILF